MFHFPAFPPRHLCIQCRVTRHHSCRVSPFGHPRINARLAAPRGLSQPPTSFIGSQCQGIHHAPLNTYNDNLQTNLEKLHIHTSKLPAPRKERKPCCARCSQPLSTNQTPHPTTKAGRQQPHPHHRGATSQGGGGHFRFPNQQGEEVNGLVVSKPNSVSDDSSRRPTRPNRKRLLLHPPNTHYRRRRLPTAPCPRMWTAGDYVNGAP